LRRGELGLVRGRAGDKKGGLLLGRIVSCESVCLRRLAAGKRGGIVAYGRFLANPQVTAARLIEGWGVQTSQACAGRHVLAIQDTSEVNFATTAEHDRGLGKLKSGALGLLLHAMLAVDAGNGGVLGLVTGEIWTREGLVATARDKRALSDKESQRWLETGKAAGPVLAQAAMVTEISDRESDLYAKWALLPEPNYHVLTRAWHDRPLVGGGKLFAAELEPAGVRVIQLQARPARKASEDRPARAAQPAREATVRVSFGEVSFKRPSKLGADLAKTVTVRLVQVTEVDPPANVEALVWRLLTTHPVEDEAKAWTVVDWYRQRWIIEQFFRSLKQQGLRLEDSQLQTAERLIKLAAIAAHAACIIMQLVQARDGRSEQPARIVFTAAEIKALHALLPKLEGATALQKNPHPTESLAWAAWMIAKLGGWDGYPKSKPPGPITIRNGLQDFHSIAQGWSLRDV